MHLRTRAVVLSSLDFRDSSRIVTLLCEQGGKTPVMAKGCKNPESPFFGRLEPGTRLDAVISTKTGRSIQTLTACERTGRLPSLWEPPGFGALVYQTLELTAQLVHEHQEHTELFSFLWRFLEWCETAPQRPDLHYYPYVQMRLADLSGIGISVEEDGPWFDLESGRVAAEASGGFSYALSDWARHYLSLAGSGRSRQLDALPIERGEAATLSRLLDRYLDYHLDFLKPRRSGAIFQQLES